jgi:mannose-6-phosphate isomerase-like protein (cupin superfamily)
MVTPAEEPTSGAVGPSLWPQEDLKPEFEGQRGRWIIPPDSAGWTGVVMGEWELSGAGWEDVHPNAETNYVLQGELYVECAGRTVIARAGDTVQVPGGQVGRYWAPKHARMVAFHGPNPSGTPTEINRHWVVEQQTQPAPNV